MLHATLVGSHWAAGAQMGRLLAGAGLSLPETSAPAQRRQFAAACLPLYKAHCPQLLQEIEGLAHGLGLPAARLRAFLFGMYCFPGPVRCTCFALRQPGGVWLGRNSDFAKQLAGGYASLVYRLPGAPPFLGNTTAFVQLEDGANAAGLAAGLTFVYPTAPRPGLNAGVLLRLLLEGCATVAEALAMLRALPIGSAQTLVLADAGGDIALVECSAQGLAVRRPAGPRAFVHSTNHFALPAMAPHQWRGPDTVYSHRRHHEVGCALAGARRYSAGFARQVLAGRHGFACQYPPSLPFGTVWSAVYDLGAREIWRAEGDPRRAPFVRETRPVFGAGR